MRRIATVVMALSVAFTATAFGSTSRTLGFGGYGPAKWGLTVAQTEHALGVSFNCTGSSCACPTADPSLPVQLAFANGRLVASWTYDETVKTTRGIHKGSTAAAVRAAYPHAKKHHGTIGGAATTYLLARGKSGVIAFELTGSGVSGIDNAPTAATFSEELCG